MDDLVAEHETLMIERDGLRKLCVDEWETMPAQTARRRNERLLWIHERLLMIERSQQWKRRDVSDE